jgi:hypothetical protein
MKMRTGHIIDAKDQSYTVGPSFPPTIGRRREWVKQYDLTVRVYDKDDDLASMVGTQVAMVPIAHRD